MSWKKHKYEKQNNARLKKVCLGEKMQNVTLLLVVMTNHTAELQRTATSKNQN